jgi:hypothetical protein
MKAILLILLTLGLLWSKYTGREDLFNHLRIAGLIIVLIILLERFVG